ncbi:MAG: hypothetical protein JW982_12685 [Spirochaetes bacterium]|nr:hypothetical protein [Spirochaetota bacterium]
MKKLKHLFRLFLYLLTLMSFSCRFDENPFPDVPYPAEEKLTEYSGKIYNVFFHPLIIYPQYAFDNDRYHNWLSDWFVTYNEAKNMIEDLYENGFVLVTVEDLVDQVSDDDTGKTVFRRRKLKLPDDKKPLLLSIDDLNFYKNTIHNGTAFKLFIDDDGKLSEKVYNGSSIEIMRGRSFITLIDEFVDKHPDFSFSGKKGLIALTGMDGILGYRSNSSKKEVRAARKVADYLKNAGWYFASHTYSHINIRKNDAAYIEIDDLKWKNEVSSITGETGHFVFPLGSSPSENSRQFDYLLKSGYSFFWSVGVDQEFRVEKNYIFMNRLAADGKCVTGKYGDVSGLFNIKKAVDPLRTVSNYGRNTVAVKEESHGAKESPSLN